MQLLLLFILHHQNPIYIFYHTTTPHLISLNQLIHQLICPNSFIHQLIYPNYIIFFTFTLSYLLQLSNQQTYFIPHPLQHLSFTILNLTMKDKYKITPAEVFKLRMQYKAEFNNLRKTYHQVVVEKSPLGKKHFNDKIIPTTILPEDSRSTKKQNHQKRHFYSPVNISQGVQRSFSRGKKQYDNKSIDNLTQVLKQKYQAKKKSLSQAILSKGNKSTINLSQNESSMTGLKLGLNDKSLTHIPKSCIKINQKYYGFNNSLLG